MPNSSGGGGFGQYMAVKGLKRDAAGDVMTFPGGAEVITPMFEQPPKGRGGLEVVGEIKTPRLLTSPPGFG
jgi:hypothetical protein